MTNRLVLFIVLVVMVIASSATALILSCVSPAVTIQSDGEKYRISKPDENAIPTATPTPAANLLPETNTDEKTPPVNPLLIVGDKETLLELLLDRGVLYDPDNPPWQYYDYDVVYEASGGGDSAMTVAQSDSMRGDDSANASHSETNEQVEGVSEGDLVKTDGKYIYALTYQDSILRIVRADGANLEIISKINLGDITSSEFYLVGDDRLVVIGNEYRFMDIVPTAKNSESERSIADDSAPGVYGNLTVAVIFDISDKSKPAELRRVSMEGYSVSTRVIDSTIYMVTNKYIQMVPYDMADSPVILPYCRDTATDSDFNPIAFNNIYVIPESKDNNYLMVGAIDIYSDNKFEPTAYLGAGSNFYMNRDAMYVVNTYWETRTTFFRNRVISNNKTEILRFAIDGTEVIYTGKGTTSGNPLNQYSMDEYNGYFRIATTDWGIGTFVTVMDVSDMKTVGQTEPLAPNELMRSMRFMGDMGYVVTFEHTDPLFTIDLSDPKNPMVLGELKIPGFSQYLHPVGKGLMIGVGRDTEEIYTRDEDGKERVVGFRDVGMKVSLFDVSDPYDPKELDVLKLGEGWAEVSNNPRAFMADQNRGYYGFIYDGWNLTGNDYKTASSAIILSVDNGRLKLTTRLNLDNSGNHSYGSRLCYIGDTIYIVHNSGIEAYDYNTFGKLGSGLAY